MRVLIRQRRIGHNCPFALPAEALGDRKETFIKICITSLDGESCGDANRCNRKTGLVNARRGRASVTLLDVEQTGLVGNVMQNKTARVRDQTLLVRE